MNIRSYHCFQVSKPIRTLLRWQHLRDSQLPRPRLVQGGTRSWPTNLRGSWSRLAAVSLYSKSKAFLTCSIRLVASLKSEDLSKRQMLFSSPSLQWFTNCTVRLWQNRRIGKRLETSFQSWSIYCFSCGIYPKMFRSRSRQRQSFALALVAVAVALKPKKRKGRLLLRLLPRHPKRGTASFGFSPHTGKTDASTSSHAWKCSSSLEPSRMLCSLAQYTVLFKSTSA